MADDDWRTEKESRTNRGSIKQETKLERKTVNVTIECLFVSDVVPTQFYLIPGY